jgi:hypothetical protein
VITSDRQFGAAKKKLKLLKTALSKPLEKGIALEFQASGRQQVQAMIKEIESEIRRYEALRERGLDAIEISSLADVMTLPIEYRIAKHLTQEQFAEIVDVPLRQICRYEASQYTSINGETFKKILEKLSSSTRFAAQLSEVLRPKKKARG